MMFITDLFFKFFAAILETLGNVAAYKPCFGYFDEVEVPEELTNLKR
ncbi:cyclic lactone autoinducer peptide [Staphylococcus devriesei]|uniref:Cyclic lactone autoinducer peptide n=1 Tax=Staphylococcus devriesei TaxID=586733 RepID=A0A2T4KLS9_9STAP|nr:cyclic lactone autoinducer peptide [Staphylococcus devriesei]PTF02508.1 cyclic lactone autoinducer peptide [Staphylococcus devriesei]PTF14833.1 cyclic lactone autoinducer peptide [Staphylococcus devriesei]